MEYRFLGKRPPRSEIVAIGLDDPRKEARQKIEHDYTVAVRAIPADTPLDRKKAMIRELKDAHDKAVEAL